MRSAVLRGKALDLLDCGRAAASAALLGRMVVDDQRQAQITFRDDAGDKGQPVVGDQDIEALVLDGNEAVQQLGCRQQIIKQAFP